MSHPSEKVIKAELRTLARHKRLKEADLKRFERSQLRALSQIQRRVTVAQKATGKSVAKIDRRMAILEGRLA